MADTELLPCPFCGATARIESNRDWHKLVADHDDNCILDNGDPVTVSPAQDGYKVRIAEEWNRRTTPPSPSTAPEVPPFPESFGLADVPHAMNTPDDWDADYRATWQKLQVAEINLSQMRAYARKLRAALASRPAEVDDEDLPLPESKFCAWLQHGRVWNAFPHGVGDKARWDRGGYWSAKGFDREPLFTAEQYRQGQRDAVTADRARREDGWISVDEQMPPRYRRAYLVYTPGNKCVVTGHVSINEEGDEQWYHFASGRYIAEQVSHWMELPAAPSHTTNKEK